MRNLPYGTQLVGRTGTGAGFSEVPVTTRLILNERFLAFPYGQNAPASVLEAAFELGKQSGPLGVDANPFLYGRSSSWERRRYGVDPYRGAEAVAWLRGHYLASRTVVLRDAA